MSFIELHSMLGRRTTQYPGMVQAQAARGRAGRIGPLKSGLSMA